MVILMFWVQIYRYLQNINKTISIEPKSSGKSD